MNRSEVLRELESLTYNHDEENCEGCSKCTKISNLRNILLGNEKVEEILAKGQDMTKREVAYLLVKEVSKQRICEVLKMNVTALNKMISNWGWELEKGNRGGEMSKLKGFTESEYQDFKDLGLNDEEIAEKKGVSPATIWSWKKKIGLTGTRSKSIEPKAPVTETNTSKVNELQLENEQLKSELETTKKSLYELRKMYEESVPSEEFHLTLNQNDQLNHEIEMAREENEQMVAEIGFLRGLVGIYLKAQ